MRSGNPSKRLKRPTAKSGGEAAEVVPDTNVAESSRGGLENQSKRAKKSENGLKRNGKQVGGVSTKRKLDYEDTVEGSKLDDKDACIKYLQAEDSEDSDECDWEEGVIQVSESAADKRDSQVNEVTVEFSATPDSSNRKNVRRFTAEEKEAAELVHRVHLLCLIARGRIIDNACNDPLIQAALLSILPPNLVKIPDVTKLPMYSLSPLVTWFNKHFHVRSTSVARKAFPSALSLALGTQEGSPEEVVALSVALFRALNLSARFVSILDVASLKPKREKSGGSYLNASGVAKDIFDSSTLMVEGSNQSVKCINSPLIRGRKRCEASVVGFSKLKTANMSKQIEVDKSEIVDDVRMKDQSFVEAINHGEHAESSRRRGDLEFELQMEMALAATMPNLKSVSQASPSSVFSPLKRVKSEEPSSSQYISTAFGCEKVGAPLCWAEVYCNDGDVGGKWVHVDVVHALINGEKRVEAAASACKKPLRYVVAFARNGAKDVTRRYCAEWHKIASKRVNSAWWDGVLAPLRELESGATGRMACGNPHQIEAESSTKLDIAERASFEDMELATRALTEPLPTNQLAYRNHSLYAIERWVTKYQILHPKGPVLGFVSGHAVYPRSCVKTLHTREMWLREGLQIRANELPVKIVKKNTSKQSKGQISGEEDSGEVGSDGSVSLYGKWQTEPLRLQPAVNGIVPKNERGQVDVWSEKCLPPGTVHLRLPRLVPIVERLKIHFAPAMVGFEFRNGRSVPVYEGIVVCTEFKDAVLEAYAEQEERREEEEKKRDERQALSRWYQLLSSMVTRRRLDESYRQDSSRPTMVTPRKSNDRPKPEVDSGAVSQNSPPKETLIHASMTALRGEHQHVFVVEDESFHEADGTLIRTKRCNCGFVVQVEEL